MQKEISLTLHWKELSKVAPSKRRLNFAYLKRCRITLLSVHFAFFFSHFLFFLRRRKISRYKRDLQIGQTLTEFKEILIPNKWEIICRRNSKTLTSQRLPFCFPYSSFFEETSNTILKTFLIVLLSRNNWDTKIFRAKCKWIIRLLPSNNKDVLIFILSFKLKKKI